MGAFLALIDPISKILDRVLPDKAQAAAAKAQLLESEVQGEFNTAIAQINVNTQEAQSKSVFVAGWRPFVGWVCGASFAWTFALQPALVFILLAFHSSFDVSKLPKLDISEMMPVLLGMLGLAGMRSYEKVNGIQAGQ